MQFYLIIIYFIWDKKVIFYTVVFFVKNGYM